MGQGRNSDKVECKALFLPPRNRRIRVEIATKWNVKNPFAAMLFDSAW